MEDNKYDFLKDPDVCKYFADINIALLRGTHIQNDHYYLFQVLKNKKEEFTYYYLSLYGLVLIEDKKDNEIFYYLDFPDEGKGKLYQSDRFKELTEQQTIMGIILMNMYYERYFNISKIVTWDELKKAILDGEFNNYYKRLFLGEVRNDYTDPEWDNLRKRIKKLVSSFEALGWVRKISGEESELNFELRPSINRFTKLYTHEIEHFDEFYQKIINMAE